MKAWTVPAAGPRGWGPAPCLAAGRLRILNSRFSRNVRSVAVSATAGSKNPRTARLRQLLRGSEILIGPCCHDGLSARLIERAGFPFAFMSGFCASGARLGAPDTGLMSYNEMVDVGRYANEATRQMPIIGDGDTGYGNAMNVKRTVRGYAQAGFAGILIEDQIAPKSCGHVRNKRVTSREEAVSRIKAAVDAREEGADILIVARTDARQAVSLEEALWRVQAFAEAGADVLFIDALESEEEMRAFCSLGGAAASVPKMANNLEGGGKTPVLPPSRLQAMGFKLVAYPLSLLGVSIRAMEKALQGIKQGHPPPLEDLGTFADIQAAVGFPEYYAEEAKYALSSPTQQQQQQTPPPPPPPPSTSSTSYSYSASTTTTTSNSRPAEPKVVEPDVVLESDMQSSTSRAVPPPPPPPPSSSSYTTSSTATMASSGASTKGGSNDTSGTSGTSNGSSSVTSPPAVPQTPPGGDQSYRRLRSFRVKISDRNTGLVKLETRIPAGFLNGITALVPQVSGFNVEKLIEEAMGGALPEPGAPLISLPSGATDLIQIYLE